MTQLGVSPDPSNTLPPGWQPPGSPSGGPSGGNVPMWLVGVAVAVMLAMIAAVALVLTHGSKKPGLTYPKVWDVRVAPYAHVAEQKRGLVFKHPVKVTFQTPATFEKSVRVDESKLDAEDKKDVEQFAGLMRAVGLVGGDVDLFAAFNDATGSGTLAYYSFEDKQIYIRGQRLTPSVRPTLVHELTHALQDQYFDISDREKALEKKEDSTESSVFDAMVEGDAERVADAYKATLNAKQRKALARSEKTEQAGAQKELAKVPKIVTTLIGSPYALGETLTDVVAASGGNQAVDELFRKPPQHEAVLLDPLRIPQHDTGATKVATPKLQPGEKKFESGEFGVLTWYFMLAQRLPISDALQVADGWGGDSYVAYEKGGTACTRMLYTGRSKSDTTRMYGALKTWAGKAPGTPTTVAMSGPLVDFESCDPGKAVLVKNDFSQDALNLAATRNYMGVGFLKAGAPAARASCVSDRLVRVYTAKELNKAFASEDPELRTSIRHLAALCG